MSFQSLMNTTCDRQTVAVAQDAVGGQVETWTTAASEIPCRIRVLTERERMLLGREGVVGTHRIYTQGGAIAWSEHDRVILGGGTYDISAVNNVDEMDHHMQLDAVLRI